MVRLRQCIHNCASAWQEKRGVHKLICDPEGAACHCGGRCAAPSARPAPLCGSKPILRALFGDFFSGWPMWPYLGFTPPICRRLVLPSLTIIGDNT